MKKFTFILMAVCCAALFTTSCTKKNPESLAGTTWVGTYTEKKTPPAEDVVHPITIEFIGGGPLGLIGDCKVTTTYPYLIAGEGTYMYTEPNGVLYPGNNPNKGQASFYLWAKEQYMEIVVSSRPDDEAVLVELK